MKKVLVTGNDGFTGKHLSNKLKLSGFRVIGLSDKTSDAEDVYMCNLLDKENLQQVIAEIQPDYVVHLAAISFVGHDNADDFYRINVIGTENLLEALLQLEQKPTKVLIASSANIYGNCEKSPIHETQQPLPVNHYAMSKLAMEYMSKPYLVYLPIFYVRPFNYTGTGQSSEFVISKIADHFRRKASFIDLGRIDVKREYNNVTKVCEIYLELLKKAIPGEFYNICSGTVYSLIEIIEVFEHIFGYKIKINKNSDLIRKNEIATLRGCTKKLEHSIGSIDWPIIEDTIKTFY